MKPMCEKVLPSSNCSWRFVKYSIPNIDFNWHYHPEYEICLTLNSKGIRYVGDNIASYSQAELILVGPNLPHTWHSKPNSDGTDGYLDTGLRKVISDWEAGGATKNAVITMVRTVTRSKVAQE